MFHFYSNRSWQGSLKKIARENKLNTTGNKDKQFPLLKVPRELLLLFNREQSMSNKEELNRHRKSITNNNKETSLETSKLKESIMKLNVGIVTKESINSIKILRILVEDTIIDMMSHGKEKLVKKKMPLIGK